jgi:hypothetical protein
MTAKPLSIRKWGVKLCNTVITPPTEDPTNGDHKDDTLTDLTVLESEWNF